MRLMRSHRLSAVVDGAEHPCRAQGACGRHCNMLDNWRADGEHGPPPAPRHGRGTRVGSIRSAVQHDRSATVNVVRSAISDAHGSQPACDRDTVGGVTIADEVARRLVPRECFGDLSGDPFGGRMCGHVNPDETSPLQTQDHQPVEKFEPNGRNDEQINGGDVRSVNAQERSPTCRGRAAPPAHVLATVDWATPIPSFSNSP